MFEKITMIDYRRPMVERAKARKFCGPYCWRPSKPGNGRGFYQSSKGLFMDRAGSSIDLRIERANDHLGQSHLADVNGYYCDPYGDGETLRPIVARLPRSRGCLAGWTMGGGMCASLGGTIYEDIQDAARAAHDDAEQCAEREREYQESQDAELDD
jgi:hypothetical protein